MEKRDKIEELTKEEFAMVHVRSDIEGVALPANLIKERSVALKISHYFANPLFINDNSLEIELLFNNIPFNCKVPYQAIWACTSFSGDHYFWEEDLPEDLLQLMADVKRISGKYEGVKNVTNIISLEKDKISVEKDKSNKEEKKPKKSSGHLKLVK